MYEPYRDSVKLPPEEIYIYIKAMYFKFFF